MNGALLPTRNAEHPSATEALSDVVLPQPWPSLMQYLHNKALAEFLIWGYGGKAWPIVPE